MANPSVAFSTASGSEFVASKASFRFASASNSIKFDKLFALNPALFHINHVQENRAESTAVRINEMRRRVEAKIGHAQAKEECERHVIVIVRCSDDSRRHERANERRCFAHLKTIVSHNNRCKDEIDPTTEKRAKNKNLQKEPLSSVDWIKRSTDVHLRQRGYLTDHSLTVRVPRTDHQAIENLIQPFKCI